MLKAALEGTRHQRASSTPRAPPSRGAGRSAGCASRTGALSRPISSSWRSASGRNAGLARMAGIAVKRGIVVDDQLQTSAPGIYAIGECAEHRGICYGLVEPAYEQARVLASHLAGETRSYGGSLLATNLEGLGRQCLLGRRLRRARRDRADPAHRCRARRYRKLVIKDGRAGRRACSSAIRRTRSGISISSARASPSPAHARRPRLRPRLLRADGPSSVPDGGMSEQRQIMSRGIHERAEALSRRPRLRHPGRPRRAGPEAARRRRQRAAAEPAGPDAAHHQGAGSRPRPRARSSPTRRSGNARSIPSTPTRA